MEYVIFAIDNGQDVHARAKFLRHMDTAHAMGKMQGVMHQCIGYWEGVLETSYILTLKDYRDHVFPHGFTRDQQCVLIVPQDQRQPCHTASADTLEFIESVGPMREVSSPAGLDAWTYNEALGKYFATKQE